MTNSITQQGLAALLERPHSLPDLIQRPRREIFSKKNEAGGAYAEIIEFVPDKDGSFWLCIDSVFGQSQRQGMGIKFTPIDDGKTLLMSSPFRHKTAMGLPFRPVLGMHTITNIERLICETAGYPLKDTRRPAPRPSIEPLF